MPGLKILRLFRGSARNAGRPKGPFAIGSGVRASVHKDGIVFLHSSKGAIFSANRVAASIWQGVCDGRTVDEISSEVSREFDGPPDAVRKDAESFIAHLLSKGILDRATR